AIQGFGVPEHLSPGRPALDAEAAVGNRGTEPHLAFPLSPQKGKIHKSGWRREGLGRIAPLWWKRWFFPADHPPIVSMRRGMMPRLMRHVLVISLVVLGNANLEAQNIPE